MRDLSPALCGLGAAPVMPALILPIFFGFVVELNLLRPYLYFKVFTLPFALLCFALAWFLVLGSSLRLPASRFPHPHPWTPFPTLRRHYKES
jgi:hypothetical protein